jgi:hypothetical protein
MRGCGKCEVPLVNSTLIARISDRGNWIKYLTCDECGHDNLVTGWINPQPVDPNEGYLKYNERTNLFDEYDNDGVMIRANVIPSPSIRPSRPSDNIWPNERRKPKFAGVETWLDASGMPYQGQFRIWG